MEQRLSEIRTNYMKGELDEQHVHPDPYKQFELWMSQALESGIDEPNAMTLATIGRDGKPSARMVLLKGFDERGFVFFTNYESRKGRDIAGNHRVALVLYWKELERQVRIEGFVLKTSGKESDDYFHSRPADSRINAIISPQSSVVPDRQHLENIRDEYLQGHSGEHMRPAFWGGYQVIPETVEFWQGRPNRLHDRIQFEKKGAGWIIKRLAP